MEGVERVLAILAACAAVTLIVCFALMSATGSGVRRATRPVGRHRRMSALVAVLDELIK